MIGALHNLARHLRIWVVAALVCLTIGSVLSSARANVITATHLSQGEQMLPDGGWTAACEIRIEHCTTDTSSIDPDGLYGPHHHHHGDGQFGPMSAANPSAAHSRILTRAALPAYAAVVKSAAPSPTDQPPKI